MVVDDSQLIVERMYTMLSEQKDVQTVYTAANYDEAVHLINHKKPDIVFLDIHLPGKNGIELLKYIVENFPGTKNVMLSNMGSSYYRQLCKETGALHFIDKSSEFDLIPQVLASISVK